MLNLINKEFKLCVHPTNFVFLFFAALLFVPNYPYEVVFFFSSLSMFFYCLTSRENNDLQFTCSLPVKKGNIPIARIFTSAVFQVVLIIFCLLTSIIKCSLFPAEMIINQAGISANFALVGNGAIMLGIFNLIFFPRYFKNPDRIGTTFVLSSAVLFIMVIIFIVLRWAMPMYSEVLNGPNAENTLSKVIYLLIGLMLYAVMTYASCKLSVKNFLKVDL